MSVRLYVNIVKMRTFRFIVNYLELHYYFIFHGAHSDSLVMCNEITGTSKFFTLKVCW